MPPVSITISIVEDDAPVRGVLTEWIRGAEGFKCIGVHENAEVALSALPQEKPSVVLMDINMPGMSGIECVRRLKPQMMDTQFMMLTVYEDPDHIFKALSSGASGYMLKRTPRAELLHISVPTVNTHIHRIYEKLHVRSRSQAIAKFTHIPNAAVAD